ncbi:hypothetical protein F1542_10645 [Komagataeibacter sp. FXV3]|nr:hypothetical protein [Komagataeibacter sp. FXV3]
MKLFSKSFKEHRIFGKRRHSKTFIISYQYFILRFCFPGNAIATAWQMSGCSYCQSCNLSGYDRHY